MNGAVSELPKRRGVATIMICSCVNTEGGFNVSSVDELGSRLSFGRPEPVEPDRQETSTFSFGRRHGVGP